MRGDRGAPNEIFPLPELPSVDLSSVPVGLHLLLGLPLCSQAWPPQLFRPDGGEAGVGAHPDLLEVSCRTWPGQACFLSMPTSPNTGWAKRDASKCSGNE